MTAVYQRDSRNISKKYAEYFAPTVLTVMAGNIAAIVDMIIVGNLLGSDALSAISVLSPIMQLYASLSVLVGLGLSATVAKAKGEGDAAKADGFFTAGMILLFAFCLVLMGVQLPLLSKISSLLVRSYYLPYVISTPLTLFLNCFTHILRLDGRPKFATTLIVISNSINLCCDIIYISVFHWGIAGASVATITGQAVAFLILLSHFAKKRNTLHFDFSVARSVKKVFAVLKELVPTGFSAALGMLLLVIKLQFVISLVQQISGNAGIVAFTIYKNVLIFVSVFISGSCQTMIPIASMCVGEKDYDGAKIAFYRALNVLLITSALVIAILIAIPEKIAMIFGVNDAVLILVSSAALRLSAFSFAGVSISFLCLYYFMAAGKQKMSTAISVLNTVGFVIPSALVCSAFWGISGVWVSFVVSEVLTIIAIAVIVAAAVKKSNGLYADFFLLPKTEAALSLSFEASAKNSSGVSQYIEAFLLDSQTDKRLANKTALAVEDITASIAKNSGENKIPIDVRVAIEGGTTSIAIRYGGPHYNPLEETGEFTSAEVVKAISKSVEYSSVLGFNRILILIEN